MESDSLVNSRTMTLTPAELEQWWSRSQAQDALDRKVYEAAQMYLAFREQIKRDLVKAQALVWNTGGRRREFDAAIRAAMRAEKGGDQQ